MSVVEIVEVSPRDGLQNERRILPTEEKAALVEALIASGARRLEVTSFVHPQRVPQMADAEALLDRLGDHPGVSFIGLVLNERGAHRAIATGQIDELNYVVPVTDSFGEANQGVSIAAALQAGLAVRDLARAADLQFSVTLAVSFGCPYEGDVELDRLAYVVGRAAALEPDELALADTIGCAVPRDVTQRLRLALELSSAPLRVHFHETRHTGLANAQAALDAGVRVLDSSAAGIGGCPFAPGAAGNVATEDLLWMLERSGYQTGLDVDGVVDAGRRVCSALGVEPRSGVAGAGAFPRPRPA